MPAISYRLTQGSQDPLAKWLQATAILDLARSYAEKSGDRSSPVCKGVQLRKKNEIVIASTAVIADPQATADAVKRWIDRSFQLAEYDFVITIECYNSENRKVSVTSETEQEPT